MVQPTYVTYSEELRHAIAAADVDMVSLVEAELERDGITAEVRLGANPLQPGSEDRDVVMVILAAGVAATLLGAAVARVIDAVTKQRRAAMVEQQLYVTLDASGKPVLDKWGNPVYNVLSKPGDMPAEGKEQSTLVAGTVFKYEYSRS